MSTSLDNTVAADGGNRQLVLMNPGPVNTDDRVRAALAGPDLCHREPEFSDLMTRVRHKVVQISGGGTEHTSVVLTGSGTAAVEAIVASAVPEAGGLLILDNGHYGERFCEIASGYGIRSHRLSFGWGVPIDLEQVDAALAADPGLTHVAMVHHETSTGMLNPVAQLTAIAHRHHREVIVDAISSVGAEDILMDRDSIDWLAGSSNKCIEGMPGLGFVCARKTSLEALSSERRRGYYLDLHRHYRAQAGAAAPAFTPGIPAYYAFDQALDLALEEGVDRRHSRYRDLAERLRSGLTSLGLQFLLPAEQQAVALTAIRLPAGVVYDELHAWLKEQGFVIYTAQEQLAPAYFRLSTMGCMTADDVDRFLAALAAFLSKEAPEHPDTAS
ncbi:2-aminoethylphosphonate aminotransferase [Streptomyces sp. NPDC003952]